MDNTQKPITPSTHPELGPVQSVGRIASGTDNSNAAVGEIIFNKVSSAPQDPVADPESFIAGECIKTPLPVTQQRADEAIGKIR